MGDDREKPDETSEIQPTPTPSETTSEIANNASEDCIEKAAFFSDVTVPDETFFNRAEPFTKT